MADTATNIENGIGLLDKWADKLGEVISQYGPDAADMALELGRIGAIHVIASGVGNAVVSAGLAYVVFRLGIVVRDENKKDIFKQRDGVLVGGFIGGAIAAVGSVLAGAVAISQISNVYAWVGLFRPEIFLAAKALGWT